MERMKRIGNVGPGLRVADIGCGRGALALELAQLGAHVRGFDLDPDQVAAARRAGVRADVADACDLAEIPDDRFDVAICRRLLMHSNRPDLVLSEMARITRPGGEVIAIEPDLVRLETSRFERSDRIALAREVCSALATAIAAVGGGDHRIGARLSDLFVEAGLGPPSCTEGAEGAGPPPAPAGIERDLYLAAGGADEVWRAFARGYGDAAPPATGGMFTCVAVVRSVSSRR